MEGYSLTGRTSGRDVVWHQTKGGCIVTTSHELNHDGYFRKQIDGRPVMVHRYFYEKFVGPVPDGMEVHHECGNRACCNVDHLKLVKQNSHVARHNNQRSVRRKWRAKQYWLRHRCTGTTLAELFSVGLSTSCRWIRTWKETH